MPRGMKALSILTAMLLVSSGLWAAPATDADVAREVLGLAGIRRGLCLHLGCGRAATPTFTAELAAASGMLVHGLALDDASLARARGAVDAKGMTGRATIEKIAVPLLPYRSDLATLVVVEDLDVLTGRGVSLDEILRVTAPKGSVCILKDGKWTKTVKPRPDGMDEWTHPYHGPNGNLVSTDKLVKLPASYRWLDGLPGNRNGFAATRAWVVANGRLFTLGINERENLGQKPVRIGQWGSGYDLYLAAHDAWNGLPLWKINCGNPTDGTAIMWQNIGPLVADDAHVYTVQKDKLIIVDAESGKILATCDTAHQPVRLLLLDGVLVAGCWQKQARPKGQWVWFPETDVGSIEAFDAATGAPEWQAPVAAFQMLASHGVVYGLTRNTAKSPMHVVALDLKTGVERWRVPHTKLGTKADVSLSCAGDGFLVVNKTSKAERQTLALDRADGHVLWKVKTRASWTPIVNGALWAGTRRDPRTGKDMGRQPTYLGGHHCRFRAIGGNYLLSNYGFSDLTSGKKRTTTNYRGARGACVENWVPANGMFYTAQNGCKCVPSAAYGIVAIGPNGAWPAPVDFQKSGPVEKGPAFGTMVTDPPAADDWPTWRHDVARSAAVATVLPRKFKVRWQVQAAPAPDGTLAATWEAQLAACLSAPVIARGRVFVVRTDLGQVVALDAATGKEVWTTTLGGRIDTPPTVHRGLCLVGCHDGWVYALDATDGRLAWRTRLAPREERMVAWGAVESVWPAVGTVLVHENVAYATAGRSTESDGGIAMVAFDPITGTRHWGRTMSGTLRLNDALAFRNGSLAWRYMKLDAKTGSVTDPLQQHTLKQYGGGGGKLEGAMIDGTWTFMRNRQAGNAFTVDKVTADIMTWNEKVIVTPAGATLRERGTSLWKRRPPRDRPVTAMVLAGDVVLVAGRSKLAPGGKATGFLRLVAVADGKRLLEVPLEVAPVHEGLAVAGGRIYLSLQNGRLLCLW